MQTSATSILLVDDEPLVRDVMTEALEQAGYSVVAAENGRVALRLLATRHFDLIITDILMPEVDGLEVIHHARRHAPAAAIIAISGGGEYLWSSTALRMATQMGALLPLKKPFTVQQLLGTVAEAMAAVS